MGKYIKPSLTISDAQDIIDQIGPVQADYAVQFEIWRTSQLNKSKVKEYQIVKYVDTNTISKTNSKII